MGSRLRGSGGPSGWLPDARAARARRLAVSESASGHRLRAATVAAGRGAHSAAGGSAWRRTYRLHAERPRTRGGAVRRQNGRAGSGVHISICPEPHDANGHPHGSSVPGAAGRARFRRHGRLRGKCEFRGGPIRFPRVPGAVFLLGDIPVMSILLTMLAPLCLLQSVEYRSPAGVEYRSQRDSGAIARLETAFAADPRNVDRIIHLGIAQSGVRQYREAIETFTRGLNIAPNNALLYRWRGHRYLSTRQFDRAMDDLTRGARFDSTLYGIWYRLGIVRFVRRDFAGAVAAFTRALPIAPDSGERSGATDWLWMSLSRAGRPADAQALLDRHPDTPPAGNAYTQRLLLYRGLVSADSVFTAAVTSDIQIATLIDCCRELYLVRGDTAQARRWFERSVASGGWPAFGFIMSEVELRSR